MTLAKLSVCLCFATTRLCDRVHSFLSLCYLNFASLVFVRFPINFPYASIEYFSTGSLKARLRHQLAKRSTMNSSAPSSHGWHSYADKFSTLESANAAQPGHLSLEAASPYRNVDDTMEGKEVWQPESERKGAGYIEGRRICGMSVKAIVILGVVVLLVVVGAIIGGVVGSRKGNSGAPAAEDTPTSTLQGSQSSLLPSRTSIIIATMTASEMSKGSASTTADVSSSGGTSITSSDETEPTSTTEDTKNAESTTTETPDTSDTPSEETESSPSTASRPPLSTTSPESPPPENSSPTSPSPKDSSSPSSSLPTLGSTTPFSANKFYTIKGANGWHIRAIDRGSTPGTWSVTAEAQLDSSLEDYWQILAVSSSNPISSNEQQLYRISNRYYGPNRPLTLTDEEWAEKGKKSVLAFPPRTKDEEDRGQYWFFGGAGAALRMYNVKSGEGYRVVMSPSDGLGVAGAEVQNGGDAGSAVFDEWIVEEKEDIKKGGDGFQWDTNGGA